MRTELKKAVYDSWLATDKNRHKTAVRCNISESYVYQALKEYCTDTNEDYASLLVQPHKPHKPYIRQRFKVTKTKLKLPKTTSKLPRIASKLSKSAGRLSKTASKPVSEMTKPARELTTKYDEDYLEYIRLLLEDNSIGSLKEAVELMLGAIDKMLQEKETYYGK